MTIRPPGRVTRTISLATSTGFGANIAPKIADDEIERLVLECGRGRLASPSSKRHVREAFLGGASVAGGHEVAGDVDAEHVGTEPRRGQRGGAVTAAEVEHLARRW